MNRKFYIDTEGNDDQAYALAMQYACELAKKDNEIFRIILFINTKQNTGWFERLYGSVVVKKMFNGYKFSDCTVPFKFETKLTYKEAGFSNSYEIVICCGLDSDDIFKIDDYYSVKYVIAIPWIKKWTQKWISTWDAIEISGKQIEKIELPEPSPIVKVAMQHLTNTINMSTGINHPMDNEKAKTYLRALHKYEPELNPDIVGAYLIRELGWETKFAKDIEKLITTLNSGSFFKGGEKTGLKDYYKNWQKECK